MTELEKIGLIPRSIVRMLDRFYYQIYLGTAEPLVKQFRFSKYLLLTSVKSLFVVLFIPFFINIFTKIYVFRPLVEYFWDRKQTEIFLNYELQEKAFSEIRNFEEKMYFDYLIKTENFFPEKPKYFLPEAPLPGELPMQKKELFGVNLQEYKFKSNHSCLKFYSTEANSSVFGFENGNSLKLSHVSLFASKYPIKFTVIKNDLFKIKNQEGKSGAFPASEEEKKLKKGEKALLFPLLPTFSFSPRKNSSFFLGEKENMGISPGSKEEKKLKFFFFPHSGGTFSHCSLGIEDSEGKFSPGRREISPLLPGEHCGKLGKNAIFLLEEEKNGSGETRASFATSGSKAPALEELKNQSIDFLIPLEKSSPQRTFFSQHLASDFCSFDLTAQTKFHFVSFPNSIDTVPYNFNKNTESIFRQKTRELANHYNNESISAITNLLADFMGLFILLFLLVNMKMSLMNTTAFLSESFFSLKDSKKAFLMLLFTDLLVGFHSPRGWEVIFHFLFEHFGLPENHNIIFLLVGTFPVLLDALFKYWIFRHLNRHSPATVATFQAMVE
uniref:Potassium/proton antiporter CemA n=1 Tax=Stigeoclonium helveticum TaxID=55999 RepID=CEMA_STIHE|nr:envelope membrane protein [Stigeoclonium helveticum]Q06SD7.1 RecName: Full=Potassium/proton antiporter CemA; AltName: Full=Chloroplast envelope membrane protein A; Short=CemA [Stigeoclonium helveticum]ABF60153.1 chloroplast envelope membrane protein [Stigeoclonium helveticum]